MKPFIQKLPMEEGTSFVAHTFRTPNFEVAWHQHSELELIFFTEGTGLSFIGNYIGEFTAGDIFFIGPNVPHTFQKQDKNLIVSAVVVQFVEDFWGKELISLPESQEVAQLFEKSMQGLKIQGEQKVLLQHLIKELEHTQGFHRIIRLCECLSLIASNKELIPLSTQDIIQLKLKKQKRIDQIFQYTIDNFKEPISLSTIAGIACMSVPAFCNYFKKSTKKTYTDFLNEIRIGSACKLLVDTELTILNICYQSGYNTLSNFNKKFLKIKKMTPSEFRKCYRNQT